MCAVLSQQALAPSMDLWRKRLSDVTGAFERASKQDQTPEETDPAALWKMVAAKASKDPSGKAHSLREQVCKPWNSDPCRPAPAGPVIDFAAAKLSCKFAGCRRHSDKICITMCF